MWVIVWNASPNELLLVCESEASQQVLVNHKAERRIICFSVRFPAIIHYTRARWVLKPEDCPEVSRWWVEKKRSLARRRAQKKGSQPLNSFRKWAEGCYSRKPAKPQSRRSFDEKES